jgi:acetoin utilization protein AcuC
MMDIDMLHHGIGSAENPVFRGVLYYSQLAVTASVTAARWAAAGKGSAFNPCGGFHHAHPDRASGFCYVNDAAIAIMELREASRRVAYVDIDAHHGDGVQAAFYNDPGVMTISMHESGRTLFPWGGFEREMGDGDGLGFNINIPLEPETDDTAFLFLFKEIVMDALLRFMPDVIVGVFGTDTFATDPLTHLKMTNNGYIEAIELLHDEFPLVVALGGGGYNMNDVVRGWTLLWAELAGRALGDDYGGAIGGVLLGDSSIEGSNLRDMRIYTTGPEAEKIKAVSERLVAWYKSKIQSGLSSKNPSGY